MTRPRLAVDIGGTFTDVAVERDGACHTGKVLTTSDDPVRGVLDGARLALARAGLAPGDVGAVIHGTTLATNALIERRAPGVAVSLSSEVSPEVREFDRLCTTVANACVKPLMAGYLGNLARGLEAGGFDCPLYLMTSGGGMTTLDTARAFPIRLVESGPSGGAVLAARVARSRGCAEVLSFDMGGTTAKVCLIEDGEPRTSRAFEVGRAERFIEGSGLPATRARRPLLSGSDSGGFRSGQAPIRLSRTRPCSTFALAVLFRSGP